GGGGGALVPQRRADNGNENGIGGNGDNNGNGNGVGGGNNNGGGGGGGSARLAEVTRLIARTLVVAVDLIEYLWTHEVVKGLVRRRRIRLDDSGAYFLNNIARISDPEFIPNNDDILHVRLQTLGVMEHTFPISTGGKTYDWKLYDVGGARGQRRAWIPYFDDATAIIFLGKPSFSLELRMMN
ncbi:hypothetical protein CVT24_002297, partial [Panaeolus cyanescens]